VLINIQVGLGRRQHFSGHTQALTDGEGIAPAEVSDAYMKGGLQRFGIEFHHRGVHSRMCMRMQFDRLLVGGNQGLCALTIEMFQDSDA
jgi:hypothetical protein